MPVKDYYLRKDQRITLPLPDNATIVIIGGGPAGAFFAIQAARKARALGKTTDLLILEKKKDLCFYTTTFSSDLGKGCNYCAGGISPKLIDILKNNGLHIPEEIITGKTELLTVHGDWKSIELPIPEGRNMYSVFRGSRPKHRIQGHMNFDSFLLEKAKDEGARVINGEVRDIDYTPGGKPIVYYDVNITGIGEIDSLEADFVVVAAGVNQIPGMALESNVLYKTLKKNIPGFLPPKVRKALICEMQTEEDLLRHMRGEVHFAQYGSRDLRIEMSSLIPKGKWITVVLIGPSVERANPTQYKHILNQFLELPHIRRLLPRAATFTPVCMCNPNMSIGVSRNAYGKRIALIGDMVVSRLYKDGIFSAYTTATALADTLLYTGIDRTSLKKGYWPTVKTIHTDNKFGKVVFLLNRMTFSHPLISRIFYQAVLTERKTKSESKHRLASILWQIASGDETYRRILLSMFSPMTVWLIFAGGVLVTIRNVITEKILDLNWIGFGRYPTGVSRDNLNYKRKEIIDALNIRAFKRPPHFERMYSIKIKADPERIFQQLGKFGDKNRQYLKPRAMNIYGSDDRGNHVGSIIHYDIPLVFLSFSVILEQVIGTQYLLYRVRDGFAKGGVLVFNIHEEEKGLCILSIYVAFDFPDRTNYFKKFFWYILRQCFPAFAHDVLWNHALCKIKHIVEMSYAQNMPPGR